MAGPAKKSTSRDMRPKFNTFSIADHAMGRYIKGKDGLWYMNGGFPHIMGFAGRGNTFKSALSGAMTTTISLRYKFEYTETYDSELSMQLSRIQDYIDGVYAQHHWGKPRLLKDMMEDEKCNWNFTASDVQSGDEWWDDHVRAERGSRKKLTEKQRRITPWVDIHGAPITMPNPWAFNVDSLSEFHTASLERKFEKGTIGEGDLNTTAMDDVRAKAQLISQMPNVAAQGGYYFGLVAHADDELQMDKYAASTKKLAGLKGNLKLKGVPGRGFTFLTNSCLLAISNTYHLNKSDKMPEYWHPTATNRVGDEDLCLVIFKELRGKSGPTGAELELIFSQREGLLVGVSEYHYLKEVLGGFGLQSAGNGGTIKSLDIYPDVKFTRKTLRGLLKEDERLSRAMSITAAIGHIYHNNFDLNDADKIPMAEVYQKITENGFDWDKILLGTVEYWYFEDQAKEINKPTITGRTIIDMANGVLTSSHKVLKKLVK